jgi:hypothetical protein
MAIKMVTRAGGHDKSRFGHLKNCPDILNSALIDKNIRLCTLYFYPIILEPFFPFPENILMN